MWSMYYSIYVAFFFSFQNLAFFSELRIIEVSGDEYGVLISTPVVFSGKFVLSSKITDDWGKWWYMYVVLISASVAFFVRSPSMSSNALNGLFYNGAWYLLFGIDKFLCEFRKKNERKATTYCICMPGGRSHAHALYSSLFIQISHMVCGYVEICNSRISQRPRAGCTDLLHASSMHVECILHAYCIHFIRAHFEMRICL